MTTGPRSTADGRSTASINKLGTDGNGLPQQQQIVLDPNLQLYSNLHELQEQDLYEQLNSLGLPQQHGDYPMSPLKQVNQFDPIPEVPGDDDEQEEVHQEEKKKYRPPPNPKPKKKPMETEQNGGSVQEDVKGDDDGTEV